jgi:hypothetical protein
VNNGQGHNRRGKNLIVQKITSLQCPKITINCALCHSTATVDMDLCH